MSVSKKGGFKMRKSKFKRILAGILSSLLILPAFNVMPEVVFGAEQNNAAEQPYYFVKSNFEDVEDGIMPAGWSAAGKLMDTEKKYSAIKTDVGADGSGKALKIEATGDSGDVALFYKFGEKLIAGETATVEFDVKDNGSEWRIGLVQEQGMWLYNNKASNGEEPAAYFADTVAGADSTHLGYNGFSWDIAYDGRDAITRDYFNGDTNERVTIEPNVWKHIKVTISFEDNAYIFEVDGKTYKEYLNHHSSNPTKTNIWTGNKFRQAGYNKDYTYGIVGLKLYKRGKNLNPEDGNNYVSFDNIKVSNPSSYLTNRNYDNVFSATQGASVIPPTNRKNTQWWMVNVSQQTSYDYTYDDTYRRADWSTNTECVEGDDYCVTFPYNSLNAQGITSYLDHHIKAGKPFVVEYDALATTKELQWSLMLLKEENMTASAKNINGNWNDVQQNNDCIINYSCSWAANELPGKPGEIYICQTGYCNTSELFLDNISNERLTYDANKWYTYKLLVEPISSTEAMYTLMVKDKDTGDYVVSKRTTNKTPFEKPKYVDFYTKDTVGIGILIPKGEANTGKNFDANNAIIKFDNLKVYNTNDKNVITAAPAIDGVAIENITVKELNGDIRTYSTSDTPKITTSTESVKIRFDKPVSESKESLLDKLYLRYANKPGMVDAQVDISEDKRTVIFNINALNEGDRIQFYVNKGIDFKGVSGASTLLNDYAKNITVEKGDDVCKINSFKLFKKTGEGWIEANPSSILSTDELKVIVTGYAKGENTNRNFNVISATYSETEDKMLSDVKIDKFSVEENGTFNREIPIKYAGGKLNVFLWYGTTLAPAIVKIGD